MRNIVVFAHAVADETRWRILQLVLSEPLCVCELAEILEMPQSSVSSHVQVIRKSGALDSERCEKWIYYRVAPGFRRLLTTLGEFFEVSPASDAVLKADAIRAGKRLAARAGSCCPLPQELVKLKPAAGKQKTKMARRLTA